jgi:transcriptional regulator with XRE-family HTH domain
MSLGDTIRKAREQHNLTQSALAERVGVTPGFITKLEKGEALPGAERLLALAGVLELKADELLNMAAISGGERAGQRIRTRGSVIRQVYGVGVPRDAGSTAGLEQGPRLGAEQLARLIAADQELRLAVEHLRTALDDPELRSVVLKTLETFARQAGRGPTVSDRDRQKGPPDTKPR